MKKKRKTDKYKHIFDHVPVAILEMDYTPLSQLARQLSKQTVTNIRQYLSEHPVIVRKTFKKIKLLDTNNAAFSLFGTKSKRELLESLDKTFSTVALDVLIEKFVALLSGDKEFSGEFKCRSADKKKMLDVFLRVSVPSRKKGDLSRVIVSFLDITPWKKIERQLRKRAQLDGLTKLLNHNTIMQRLSDELIRAKRYGLSLSCLMIDLDHFKIINDKFGHQRGDMVLKQVAGMIKKSVRNVDLVGRYGGDEFLIILPETKALNARYAARRIQSIFSAKVFKYQRIISFHIALSIGIAGYPAKKVKDEKDMITLADKAMYMAKKAGRNRIATA